MAAVDNNDQVIFYAVTSTTGAQTSRYFYVTAITYQKYFSNDTYEYLTRTQVIRGLVGLPQNGLTMSIAGQQLILKYQGNRSMFSALSCLRDQFYIAGSNTCSACDQSNSNATF